MIRHALLCTLFASACAFGSDFDAVEFSNPYSSTLSVEVRVGKPLETGNTCEQNQTIVARSLRPNETLKVSCGETYGAFCVRTRREDRSRFSDWDGTYTCGGHSALSRTRFKQYNLR